MWGERPDHCRANTRDPLQSCIRPPGAGEGDAEGRTEERVRPGPIIRIVAGARSYLPPPLARLKVTAARMSALKARASMTSPSRISIARRVPPSRLALKRPVGSERLA